MTTPNEPDDALTFRSTILPMIRSVVPGVLASNLIAVQPMITADPLENLSMFDSFALNDVLGKLRAIGHDDAAAYIDTLVKWTRDVKMRQADMEKEINEYRQLDVPAEKRPARSWQNPNAGQIFTLKMDWTQDD